MHVKRQTQEVYKSCSKHDSSIPLASATCQPFQLLGGTGIIGIEICLTPGTFLKHIIPGFGLFTMYEISSNFFKLSWLERYQKNVLKETYVFLSVCGFFFLTQYYSDFQRKEGQLSSN